MLLTEVEGKSLLQQAGILVPTSVLLTVEDQKQAVLLDKLTPLVFPVFIKAQVLYGNRQLQGLVKRAETIQEAKNTVEQFLALHDQNNQPITQVLAEEAAIFDQAYYLSIGYDTRSRQPVIRFSKEGGAGMDDRGASIQSQLVSMIEPLEQFQPFPEATGIVAQLYKAFIDLDAVLLEINPLVKTTQGWMCLDAKIELESTAHYRHPEWQAFPERSGMGRPPTQIELAAQQASRSDHRGVAGESFFEFPGGTIGVLASGGGASTLAMDALMAEGLKPANYTEYSGNPPREKVAALTRVVTSIPTLEALYIVGSNANFTDIYDTLAGVVDGFLESKYAQQPGFVILIRRGGPRWQEAFEMVKERLATTQAVVTLFGPDFPLVETAEELAKLLRSRNN
jgi:succinyl-CoA synthetase beta subunit